MTLELLLSTMNLNLSDLDKMNITTPCIVINQCGKVGYREYKNFRIYDTDDIGLAKSRNMAISKSKADILLFCDNDCVYSDNYYDTIINFYETHRNADMVFFNMNTYDNSTKLDIRTKRIHWYNYQRYPSYRITFKRKVILKKNIKVCTLFGGNCMYNHGEDTIFIHDCLKAGLNLYTTEKYIGKVIKNNYISTWFRGYDDKFFFDKGALFSVLSPKFKHVQCIQYVFRHKEAMKSRNYFKTLRIMFRGINAYDNDLTYGDVYEI